MRRKIIAALMVTALVNFNLQEINSYASEVIDKGTTSDNSGSNGSSGNDDSSESGTGTVTPPIVNNIQSKKVMISSVSTNTTNIEPGKPFTLTYRVENISAGKIDALSLKIVNVEGKSTLEGFMPVGTTNEIYVGSIGYNDIRDVSITLCSDPNTKPGIYNFVTSVMFSQWGGAQEEISKISGIMVKSTPEIELSAVESMGYNLMGTLVNDGTSKVKKVNVKVKVGSEEFEQKVGSIDSDSEEYFEVMINPVETETEASIEVTYEDLSGQKYSTTGTCMVYPVVMDEKEAPVKKSGFFGLVKRFIGFGI